MMKLDAVKKINTMGKVGNILALAYIFQYGAVLQQESDETL